MTKIAAILVASGSGQRFGSDLPKQFATLGGVPIFLWAPATLELITEIFQIVVAVPESYSKKIIHWQRNRTSFKKWLFTVPGGKHRAESVYSAFEQIDSCVDFVAVMDGVRPFVPCGFFQRAIPYLQKGFGVLAAVPVTDTLKKSEDGFILNTVSRDNLWHAQTPQCFPYQMMKNVLHMSRQNNFPETDECQMFEKYLPDIKIKLVEGSSDNIKITHPDDLRRAENIISSGNYTPDFSAFFSYPPEF